MKTETSLGKALRLLAAVGDSPDAAGVGVSDLLKATGLSRPTAYRLLGELEDFGLVRSVPRQPLWQLGPKIIALAAVAGSWGALRRRAKVEMDEFVRASGYTVHLAIRDNFEIVYIDKSESAQHMTISTVIGHRRNVHVTALGKCLVAFDSDEQLAQKVADAGLPARTPHSITDPAAWQKEIEKVRRAGFAYDDGECEAAAQCVAAPILDQYGHAVAAISFSALKNTVKAEEFERCGKALMEVARRISAGT